MKHRILSAVLVLVLLLTPAAGAAGGTVNVQEAAQVLSALDIMVGDQQGNLNLSGAITRAEFTKLLMAASPQRESVGDAASIAPYPDVPKTHWAAPYVQAAVVAGYVSGYLDGTFRPANSITLAEGVTMVLRLLGYQNSDFTGAYPAGQMALYRNLGLDEGITAAQNSAMTRQDALLLFYNLMTAKQVSTGTYYLNVLEPGTVNAKGEIDMVALLNTAIEGPVVAGRGWTNSIPFAVGAETTVYRDGTRASLDSIQDLDVVYWSKPMRTLWAYDRKVSGTLETVAPSTAAPTSITVSGKSYDLESIGAIYDCSDLGSYQVGDGVTLLLGRNGGVAAIRDLETVSREVCGMVLRTELKEYTDGKGADYNAVAVTLLATDGSQPTYQVTNRNFKPGDLVRITPGADGAEIRRLSLPGSLTGTVSRDGTYIGDHKLADDVQILDTFSNGATAVTVRPSRLAGITIKKSMVRFYALNTQGEISHLILNDVTGDMHHYGILTDVREVEDMMLVSGSYTYDIKNQKYTWDTGSRVLHLRRGPCLVKGNLMAPEQLASLTSVKIDRIEGNLATSTGNQKYTISEQAAVYVVVQNASGTHYDYVSLARVIGGSYSLTGYYDKPEAEGGQIRVILAS